MIYTVDKGRVCFGEPIGILMLDSYTPFIPGDVGNASTYEFPVRYEIVKGITVERMLSDRLHEDKEALDIVLNAAKNLERQGVRAITSDCGFMMVFQEYLKENLKTPVFLSSLLQLPFIFSIIPNNKKVAILSANGNTLDKVLLNDLKMKSLEQVIIKGLQEKPHFYDAIVVENGVLDSCKIEREMVEAVGECIKQEPNIGAILLECSVMPPYGKAVYEEFGLPVFDFYTMIRYMCSAVVKKNFEGIM